MRGALLALAGLVLQAAEPPVQPIPYSHKLHAGTLGLKCGQCHANPEPGEMMGIPATATCMACHATVKKDSPPIQTLAGFHNAKRAVPWVRIYEIPGYVSFSHRVHLEAKAACATCHGNVTGRERLSKEGDITMGACMECHRREKAPNECTSCHEPRN